MANPRGLGSPHFARHASKATGFSSDERPQFPNLQIESGAHLAERKAWTRPLLRLSFGIQQKLSLGKAVSASDKLDRQTVSTQFSKHSRARGPRRSRFKQTTDPSAGARGRG